MFTILRTFIAHIRYTVATTILWIYAFRACDSHLGTFTFTRGARLMCNPIRIVLVDPDDDMSQRNAC